MSFCFDLPEPVDDFEEQEECRGEPCFPYLVRGERPGGGNMWCPSSGGAPNRLNLREAASLRGPEPFPGKKQVSRKVLVQVRCIRTYLHSDG